MTARVPAEVRARLDTLLAAEARSFSEWLQAQVTEATDQREQAVAAGRQAGYREGLAAGRTQGRAVYLIMSAAMLWAEFGARLGDTSESWIDRRAVECVGDMAPAVRAYLDQRLQQAPKLRGAVETWLRDSDLSPLS